MSSAHCALCDSKAKSYSNYSFVFEVMSSLLDKITEAEGELRCLLVGEGELTPKQVRYADFLETKLASLRAEVAANAQSTRDLRLAEVQRGETPVCFTTVMLDEFNADIEINLPCLPSPDSQY